MNNAFKIISDFFNEVAVISADINGDFAEIESKISDYRNEISKINDVHLLANCTPAQVNDVLEVLKKANEYVADAFNDLRMNLRKLVTSVNKPDVFRDAFREVILTYTSLPTNYKIDESSINLSPNETGVHFAEYVYDVDTRKLEAKLDTELSHYSVERIVNTYIPNIIHYYESVMKIISNMSGRVLEEIEGRLRDLYKGVAIVNDPEEGELAAAYRWFENATAHTYESVNDIRGSYQIAANMVKNIGIIETAFNHYINSQNRIMTL